MAVKQTKEKKTKTTTKSAASTTRQSAAAKTKARATKSTTKAAVKTARARTSATSEPSAKKAVKKKATTVKTASKATKKTNAKTTKAASKKAKSTKTTTKSPVKTPPAEPIETAVDEAKPAPAKKKAAAKPAKLSAKAIKAAAEKEKLSVARTQLVGQKPRSDRDTQVQRPSSMSAQPQEIKSEYGKMSKSSPESKAAKQAFKVNDHIVYPAHGVGKIVGVEKQMIAGVTNELFLIVFEHEKMKLRVPTAKAQNVGMRQLSSDDEVAKALELLKGRARIKRTMWSRRAQEYEAKINSGDINQVAEVVRDLYRAADQPEQSYSERQLFEAALDRLAREVAAVKQVDLTDALNLLDASLQQKTAA